MNGRRWWVGGLLVALAVAGLLSPWASRLPDGLDWAAEHLGFHNKARLQPLVAGPMPNYQVPLAHGAAWSTPVAGITGTLVVFGGTCLLGYLLTRRRSKP